MAYIYIYIHTYINYITLHYIALHCITLHYIHTYIHIYIYTHIYIYIYTYIYIYIYIYINCGVISTIPAFLIRCNQPSPTSWPSHLREPRTTCQYQWWASCFSTSRMYRADRGLRVPDGVGRQSLTKPGSTWTNSYFPD